MLEYRFADRAALQLLGLVPLVILLAWWGWKRANQVIRSQIAPSLTGVLLRSVDVSKRRLKIILQACCLALFVLALARPQSGQGLQKAKSEGLEMVLVVDVSNSMLSEDVRPSRLEQAKHQLSRLLDTLGGDRVGLVAFAGSAILLSPLTSDKSAIKMYLESLATTSVSTQGTNFGNALDAAYRALHRGGLDSDENHQVTRVVVMASDGEDNEPGALAQARKIAEEGIRIYTLGFGTEKGGPIPVRDNMGNMVGYKKDNEGRDIVTQLTGKALSELASAGGGTYIPVTFGGDPVEALKTQIDTLKRTQYEALEVSQYNEHYQLFLFCGLCLGLLELGLGERRRLQGEWRGRFGVWSS